LQIAYCNSQLINALDADNSHHYYCPICKGKVILKKGKINIPHFAHFNHNQCMTVKNCQTNEHLLGKKQLLKFIDSDDVKMEFYIQSIKQRPDLLWKQLAIEFQCSPITLQRFRQRVSGYRSIQMKSLWVLGSNYRRNFGQKNMIKFYYYFIQLGFCMFFWDVKKCKLEMFFNCQYVNGKLYHQVAMFTCLMDLLHYLRQSHQINSYHSSLKQTINEITHIRNNLFYKDKLTLKIQEFCYLKHHCVDGSPLICHKTSVVNPLVGSKYLYWKIIILNELIDGISISDLYIRSVSILKLTANVPLIKNKIIFLRKPFNDFLRELVMYNYIFINSFGTISYYHKIYWFRDYYHKLQALIMKE
jgi:competence protein CoiA